MESHVIDSLTPIALVMSVALIFGVILMRLKQPAIVGYILAGIALGPTGMGLVSNSENVQILAELGVIMLLFLIGMELSLRAFKTIYKIASLTALCQIGLAVCISMIAGFFLEWSFPQILVLGFAFALSSTAVAIKILEDTGDLRNHAGRLTIGVLIAQDLAVVPILLTISALGTGGALDYVIFVKLGLAIGILVFLTWFLTRRERLNFPFLDTFSEQPDMLPLMAMAFCFSLATMSGVVGMSAAYGAFIAGLIIGNSNARAHMHHATMPIQTILLMVFFLSIGLLIDLHYIWDNLGLVLGVLLMVTLFKTIMNIAIIHVLGEPWDRSFLAGVVMGQIGEFSFIVIGSGLAMGIVEPDNYRLIIAVIALSLMISPLWLVITRRLHRLAEKGWVSFIDLASLGRMHRRTRKNKKNQL